MTTHDDSAPGTLAALDRLAAALNPSDFLTTRATVPGQPPRLAVASRHARQLAEDIYAADGWYWWSWAERIAPTGDPETAARKVGAVLRASPCADATSPAPPGHDAA